jgi:hypothetical protein
MWSGAESQSVVEFYEVVVILEDGKATIFIEWKINDLKIGKGFLYLHECTLHVAAVQVVLEEERDFKRKSGIHIAALKNFQVN